MATYQCQNCGAKQQSTNSKKCKVTGAYCVWRQLSRFAKSIFNI